MRSNLWMTMMVLLRRPGSCKGHLMEVEGDTLREIIGTTECGD